VRTQTSLGPDVGMVEFWSEDDARTAESAMHCAELDGQNIAVQIYQPRRTTTHMDGFNASAPPFVPTGALFSYPAQVRARFV